MRSDEYKAAIITIIASGSRATSTLVRIFRFASRPMSAFPPMPKLASVKREASASLGVYSESSKSENCQNYQSSRGKHKILPPGEHATLSSESQVRSARVHFRRTASQSSPQKSTVFSILRATTTATWRISTAGGNSGNGIACGVITK